jgi:hypothetical protein
LDLSTLSPHGICLLWEPLLIWLHVTFDAIIAASYFSIPFALAIVVSKPCDFQIGRGEKAGGVAAGWQQVGARMERSAIRSRSIRGQRIARRFIRATEVTAYG